MLIVWCVAATAAALSQQSNEQLAVYYFDRGEYAQAAQLYEGLYAGGDNKYYYRRLLESYTALGQYREAHRLVEQRQRSHRGDLYLWVDEGTVYLKQRQEKKALKCFDRAIEAVSTNLQPIPELAQAFVAAGRADYAVRTYLAVREKTRNRQLYFAELVGVYQQMGDYEAMTQEYFDLLDAQPGMMRSVQVSMQHTLQEAPDRRLSDGVRKALVSRVREHPDNRTYLEMMVWFSLQEKDFRFALEQAQAVDARFPDIGAEQLMRVSQIAQSNGALDVAAEGYRYLQAKGKESPYYFDAKVGELEVEYARVAAMNTADSKAYTDLQSRYLAAFAELGKNERTIPLMRHYAQLMAYHVGEVQEAVSMLDDVLEVPRIKPAVRDEVKLELGDLLLFAGEVWDASLLYMQVEKANKNDILGAQAKFRNAKLSYYNHDFEWAVSQLKVLRASTSKLVANDAMELSLLISDNMDDDSTYTLLEPFADADLLLYRNMLDSAWDAFDAIARRALAHPLFDEILLRKAQIRIKQARYTEADSLLARLVEFYPDDITADDALMLRAEINEQHLDDRETARACYERLLIDYPSSLYVDQARKHYNLLKAR